MSTFNDLFVEAKSKKVAEPKKAAKEESKKEKKVSEKKDEVKEVKPDHPKDDPAIRKARKERRRLAKADRRNEDEAAATKQGAKKEKRVARQEAWQKAREMIKTQELEMREHEMVVEDAVDAVGRLQAMIAAGATAGFKYIMDPSTLEDTNIKIKAKRQKNIDKQCDILEKIAKGLLNSTVSPYVIATRLANVANAFLTAFEPLLKDTCEPEEVKRIMQWIKDQRSFINKEKQRLVECSKDFVPAEAPLEEEAGDEEEAEGSEDEQEVLEAEDNDDNEEEVKQAIKKEAKSEKKAKKAAKRPAEDATETKEPKAKKAKKAKK